MSYQDDYNESNLVIDLSSKQDMNLLSNSLSNSQTKSRSSNETNNNNLNNSSNKKIFREIYYSIGKQRLKLEICLKLEDLIDSGKLELEDLNNSNLIDSLTNLENEKAHLLDDYFDALSASSTKFNVDQLDYFIRINSQKSTSNNHSEIDVNNNNISNNCKPIYNKIDFELYVGRIPSIVNEDELIHLFSKYGKVNYLSFYNEQKLNNGYKIAFTAYSNATSAKNAIENLNNYEIRIGCKLVVKLSDSQLTKVTISNIPEKIHDLNTLKSFFSKIFDGLINVKLFEEQDLNRSNNISCCLQFSEINLAYKAREKLSKIPIASLFNFKNSQEQQQQQIQSKQPQTTQSEYDLSENKLFVKNISDATSEKDLYSFFSKYGQILSVNKKVGFGFVKFSNKDSALTAMHCADGALLDSKKINVMFAKSSNHDSKNYTKLKQLSNNETTQTPQIKKFKRKIDTCPSESSSNKRTKFNSYYNYNKYNKNDGNKENRNLIKSENDVKKINVINRDPISWD